MRNFRNFLEALGKPLPEWVRNYVAPSLGAQTLNSSRVRLIPAVESSETSPQDNDLLDWKPPIAPKHMDLARYGHVHRDEDLIWRPDEPVSFPKPPEVAPIIPIDRGKAV
jgi:hypothetical protein